MWRVQPHIYEASATILLNWAGPPQLWKFVSNLEKARALQNLPHEKNGATSSLEAR